MNIKDLKYGVAVLAIGATTFYFTENYIADSRQAKRTIASEAVANNCLDAVGSFLGPKKIEPFAKVNLVLKENARKVNGKIVGYTRSGFEIRGYGSHQLVSYNEISTINGKELSSVEIYRLLLAAEIGKTNSDQIQVRVLNNIEFEDIKGHNFKTDGVTISFQDQQGVKYKIPLEEIYHFSAIDPVDVARKEVQTFEGEFVSVRLTNGDVEDGVIVLSADRKFAELTSVHDETEVVQIPLDEIELVIQ
ncbi:hypothetical protein [Halobacteriovorax sp. DA5]|uniref:hypothetical protein n=1 Tax=Halobacteriovorax sp. DA5 TaxID=2067553 RepID=UPI000CD1410F|nr:hypothetical protein [Halobacteriovorax sp. DA5]POB12794.1 hypothetical protein C0Z22_13000 [Halobacteriovorax sp. DA5]